ncbi:MAG TPA: serine/threonine-protein kinase [Gemmataceae bacterium]|nr:serine/threonine-protein kinase [Gemmataceae bacterium]
MSTPATPEPSERPSSVVRHGEAPAPPNSEVSSIAKALPQPDSTENAPTIISPNRPKDKDPNAVAAALQGKKLGHFELDQPIGVGGMAAVIRAKDLQLGRIVALKVLPPEMAVDPENVSRFKAEARAAARLDHENIARVYFCGEDQGLHFIAFEYVEGIDLRTWLNQNGVLTPQQAVTFMLQIATGLAHAAERGVVHRDVKPSNILITKEGRAKIVDMGLARQTDVAGGVTQSGVTLGTFDYISPEQAIDPRGADIRSDIYSLGCTFYHLLTGQPPVPEGTAAKKLHHHQQVEPLDPREFNPAIPDELAAILARMMAKDPKDRYQTPAHLVQHLFQMARKLELGESGITTQTLFLDAPLPQSPRYLPWMIGVVALSALTILVVILGWNGFHSTAMHSQSLWPEHTNVASRASINGGAVRTNSVPQATPPVPSPLTLEPAETVQDLARLLNQHAESIKLTGKSYNLSELGADPQLRWKGRRLKIEGEKDGTNLPIICWDAPAAKDSSTFLAALELIGTDADVTFKQVRFEVQPNGSEIPQYAISAAGLQSLRFEDCEFQHEGARQSGGLVRFEGQTGAEPPVVSLLRCLMSHGPIGIDLQNRSVVQAEQCAFGPHDVLFRWRENVVQAAPNPDRLLATLTHCSVMMRNGSIFQPEGAVAGTIRASQSLFASGNERGDPGEVVLVRQSVPQGKVIFAGPEGKENWRNVYHHLTFWADGNQKAAKLADCQHLQFPFRDAHAVELAFSPWQHPQPLSLVREQPAQAFALQIGFANLRAAPKNDQLVGVERCTWGDSYDAARLPVIQEESAVATANRRVVDPSFTADATLPPLTYRTLETAISEAKSGDTILIRHTGVILVRPVECAKSDWHLTIQPDGSHRPILELDSETVKPQAALFTLFSGGLTFKDLQFHLPLKGLHESKWAGVLMLAGGAECTFQRCVITMDDNTGIPSAVVLLSADADAMAQLTDKGPPHIRLDNCFIRGRGDLLTVRPSRPFQLELNNSLIGLDGNFATIFGQPKETAFATDGQIVCNHVTTYLSDYWLDFRASEEDRKMAGFNRLQIKCEMCRFVAANNRPLLHGVGIDGETLKGQVLSWGNRMNLYGNFTQMLDVELPNATTMMPMMPLTAKNWRDQTYESEDSFVEMQIAHKPSPDRPWSRMRPDDFMAKRLDMKKSDINPNNFGAHATELPTPDDEPAPTAPAREE